MGYEKKRTAAWTKNEVQIKQIKRKIRAMTAGSEKEGAEAAARESKIDGAASKTSQPFEPA